MEDKKEKVFQHLTGIWKNVNKDSLNTHLSITSPIITIVIISWLRTDKLIHTLETTIHNSVTPLNIYLRLQESGQIKKKEWEKLYNILNKFKSYTIYETTSNEGSAPPRFEAIGSAIEKYNTPYIMTLDDDMLLPLGAIEALLNLLETKKELGSASISCEPKRNIYFIKDENGNKILRNTRAINGISYPDAVGSATQVIRKEVYETCKIDNSYFIGCWDFDFCMQMKQHNWPVAVLTIDGLTAINNNFNSPSIYSKTRSNKKFIHFSRRKFTDKWNIVIPM